MCATVRFLCVCVRVPLFISLCVQLFVSCVRVCVCHCSFLCVCNCSFLVCVCAIVCVDMPFAEAEAPKKASTKKKKSTKKKLVAQGGDVDIFDTSAPSIFDNPAGV